MCFYTRGSRIRIATKDIVCYKIVRGKEKYCCFSYYQEFKYKYNQKYSGKSKWKLFLRWFFDFVIESEGYHSYIDEWRNGYQKANVKCIIPKGSLYLIDKASGEYCSSSIIILKNKQVRTQKKILPIMKAYSEGKKIQFFNGEEWVDKEILTFDSEPHRYRIKPKTKYRPFKSQKECWSEMHKHPDFGWVKNKQWGNYASLGCVGDIIIRSEDECHRDSFEHMYTNYTFTDGEPFGIKEEE